MNPVFAPLFKPAPTLRCSHLRTYMYVLIPEYPHTPTPNHPFTAHDSLMLHPLSPPPSLVLGGSFVRGTLHLDPHSGSLWSATGRPVPRPHREHHNPHQHHSPCPLSLSDPLLPCPWLSPSSSSSRWRSLSWRRHPRGVRRIRLTLCVAPYALRGSSRPSSWSPRYRRSHLPLHQR